jgi:hypothetical protein
MNKTEKRKEEKVTSSTHQSWRTGRVVGRLAGSREDRGDFVPGEVARVQVGAYDGGQKSLLVLELRCHCLLLRTTVGALLHGSQNPGLLALGHAPESHGCNRQAKKFALCDGPWIRPLLVPITQSLFKGVEARSHRETTTLVMGRQRRHRERERERERMRGRCRQVDWD